MLGNICFRTPKGLRFFNCNRAEVQNLIDQTQKLKARRDTNHLYRFVVTIEEVGDIEADDIWIAVGASRE